MEYLMVFLGGGIGASLRYLFAYYSEQKFGLTHWATFLINIIGCIFLGFVAFSSAKSTINNHLYLFLTTGIAGGFTTFSTFSNENINLLKDGKVLESIIYMVFSLFFGILGIYLGFLLATV